MSHRRTVPRRSSQGDDFRSIRSSLEEEDIMVCNLQCRRCLISITATLTMLIIGSVNGWTTISLHYLIAGTGGAPLKITYDESSWVVSLTVLGSMIGSLVAAQLATSAGSQICLVLCNTTFTLGWFIMYDATSVPILYLARVILGIGVGIGNTVNPMYLSEILDIKIRGVLNFLIAANASIGSIVIYTLGLWMMYKSLLLALVILSFICFMSIRCFSATRYFSMATDQMRQTRQSMEYYADIENTNREEMELRATRTQTRSDLPSQSRSDLPSQSRSDLPSQSRSDLPSQSRSDLPSQSRSDVSSQSRSDLPSQSRSDLSSQSRSDIPSQSRRDLLSSQSISALHSKVICEVLPQPTDHIPIEPSHELHSQSTSELHQPSTSELRQPSTSELRQPSTSELHQPSTSEIHPEPTSEIYPEPTSEMEPLTRRESHHVNVPTKYTWSTKLRETLQRSNRKALFIMLGLIMAQQLSGNFITMQYLHVLFSKTTIGFDAHEATMLVLGADCISSSISPLQVEFIGRRKLLILSTLGSFFTLIILANYLLLDQHGFDVSNVSILPIIDLIINQVMFHIGLGTLPNVLLHELFPKELKGFVRAIIVIFNGIIGFTVPKLYQVITDNAGTSAIYFIFAASCFLAFVMVFMWLPETKGKTYPEIEALLAGEDLNSSNEEVIIADMDIGRI